MISRMHGSTKLGSVGTNSFRPKGQNGSVISAIASERTRASSSGFGGGAVAVDDDDLRLVDGVEDLAVRLRRALLRREDRVDELRRRTVTAVEVRAEDVRDGVHVARAARIIRVERSAALRERVVDVRERVA